MQNNTIKMFVSVGAAFAFVFGVIMATPAQAHAFSLGQIIDPGCFFACDNGGGGHTTKNVTNYYNGNYRSPGGTVINGNVTTAAPAQSAPVTYNNNNYSSYSNQVPYSFGTVFGTSYVPNNNQPVYYNNNSAYYNQPIAYSQPVYQQPAYYPTYQQIYVSCSVDSTYGTVGTPVTWTAYASGGTGYYTYTWSGIDGMYGSGQYLYYTYNNPGYKTASVTVYSNGQSITQQCSNGVSIAAPYYQPVVAQPVYAQPVPVYQQPAYRSSNYNGLDVGCYADPSSAGINQPVTWNVEVTGGAAPYTYSWTGSNDLSGAAATVIKYYNSSGTKNAIVTVTSADGRTATHSCSNTVTIRSSAPVVRPPVQQPPVVQQQANNNPLSANSLFSLSNIPWGWVSVLVILVLFATVVYLMFNKPKI